MVTGRKPSRLTGEIDEAKSKRYPDGSAFLVYHSGALLLVEKRAPYLVNSPTFASADVAIVGPGAESPGETQA